ncbi:ribbon-helix-helix domain-containing protein [Sphingomicrobium lutaoense]|uniref:Putative DNA-binding ribbon-helix-helix protein n=1 Tax=Sphingomicrobium lutaoense TaxID=515949 RepID=A0A839Z4J4_9SPHN|nr:ribbon-helix-helix domain-containing protein [Sphingomicrobium lutaoense]MBB3764545.1 putative DNA-binding ribbon-helix-helix protein [Sphingomicrobium lutaoense]
MPRIAPPAKRSVTIAGHETSISLEPIFWEALVEAANRRGLPVNALIAQIDLMRYEADGLNPANLASAIRQWLYLDALSISETADTNADPSSGA